ncbi:MAG TPA: TetR/AcrR family transcriptional regulator [Roseiarcus sp.]|nr:TetR/AcrR family transcriptional regulator [Roseiarcus sp.]
MNIETRPYVMKARAEKAAATKERIVQSAADLIVERTLDDLTLDAIAERAGVAVRTILRAFGGKEQVFAAAIKFEGRRGHGEVNPGDAAASIKVLYDDYEKIGDAVILRLADEGRVPSLDALLKSGRDNHRRWIEESFAPQLARASKGERAELLNALLVATDVYAWKLLRRDFGFSRAAAEAVICRIVQSLVEGGDHGSDSLAQLVWRRQSAAESRNRPRPDRARS